MPFSWRYTVRPTPTRDETISHGYGGPSEPIPSINLPGWGSMQLDPRHGYIAACLTNIISAQSVIRATAHGVKTRADRTRTALSENHARQDESKPTEMDRTTRADSKATGEAAFFNSSIPTGPGNTTRGSINMTQPLPTIAQAQQHTQRSDKREPATPNASICLDMPLREPRPSLKPTPDGEKKKRIEREFLSPSHQTPMWNSPRRPSTASVFRPRTTRDPPTPPYAPAQRPRIFQLSKAAVVVQGPFRRVKHGASSSRETKGGRKERKARVLRDQVDVRAATSPSVDARASRTRLPQAPICGERNRPIY